MAKETLNQIPVVDLNDFRDPKRRDSFTETVAKGFQDIGFIFVKTPDITPKLPTVYDAYKKVFDLPLEVKMGYERPDIHRQRGYTPSGAEIGIFCQRSGPDGKPQHDAKENWFVGPKLPDGHPFVERYPALYAPNVWPTEVPEFKPLAQTLYKDLFTVGKGLLRSMEPYLGYEKGFFDDIVKDSPTSLRPLHYPPVKPEDAENTVWGCTHTDINFITALPASTKPGLWVETRSGEWIPGMAPPDHSLVQVGDMLEYMTGGYFRSARHRVDAPKGGTTTGRYSSALFIHARSNYEFQVDRRLADDPAQYPPITAENLLYSRLQAIGLAKQEAREEQK